MQLDIQFLASVLSPDAIVSCVTPEEILFSLDSRTIQPGEIFVALKGAQCDGHDFIKDALHNGAGGIVIKKSKVQGILTALTPEERSSLVIIAVDDPFAAMLQLARAWRALWTMPVVGITGSVGKTSTKELVALITQEAGLNYFVSRANQNVLISAAINMLHVRAEHDGAIFEIATSKRGDVRAIGELVKPTIAAVTSVGHQHMDEIGSLADIAFEKRGIFSALEEHNIGVIHGDQPLLKAVSYKHPVMWVGLKSFNQIQARKIRITGDEITFILKMYGNKYPVLLRQAHEGRIMNVLTAAGIAHLLKIDDETIVRAVQQPLQVPGRFERCMMQHGSGTIINDTYNANPESVKAALLAFEKIKVDAQTRKIVVLGDMRGLGQNAPFWHRQIGRFLRKVPSLSHLILVGTEIAWIKKTAPHHLSIDMVATWQEAVELLRPLTLDPTLILVKGSRTLHLEHIVNSFVHHEQAAERSRIWHQ